MQISNPTNCHRGYSSALDYSPSCFRTVDVNEAGVSGILNVVMSIVNLSEIFFSPEKTFVRASKFIRHDGLGVNSSHLYRILSLVFTIILHNIKKDQSKVIQSKYLGKIYRVS